MPPILPTPARGFSEHRSKPGRGPRPPGAAGPADVVLGLQRSHGNRSVARSVGQRLARQPASAVAAPVPAHVPWADQTTTPNKRLGKEIDELDKLTNEALLQVREVVAVRASRYGPNHEQDVLELDAIEFLAAQRGLAALDYRDGYYSHEGDGMSRRNVRFLLEAGIRKSGSLKKAAEDIEHKSKSVERDISAIEIEANAFGTDFTIQAGNFARKMLALGEAEIMSTLSSYGLDPEWAERGVKDLAHESIDVVAEMLVNVPDAWQADSFQDEDARPRPGRQKRRSLAQDVGALKAQQRIVEDARKPMAALVKHDWQRGEYIPDQAAYDAARQRFEATDRKLKAMWVRAEDRHPVLASFRGTEPMLKDVDLGAMDQIGGRPGAKPQMKTMLTHLLPKIRDIRVLRYRLDGGYLKALSLPPVVAVTKAAMFVPEGSIREGKVNDLVAAAQDKSISTYIAEGLLALIVIATLIPSGGASLGLAIGLASAALSATSAVEDWESYKQQRMLNNTALDRARALSTEEPSLLPVAIDLISLGLDGLPLLKAFHGVIELRNLVRAQQEIENAAKLKAICDELNSIGAGAKNKDPHLGDRLAKDLQNDANASAASKPKPASEHPKPPARPTTVYGPEPPTPTSTPHPKPPSKPTPPYGPEPPKPKSTAHPKPPPRRPPAAVMKPPPGSLYTDELSLRSAIQEDLAKLDFVTSNPEWEKLENYLANTPHKLSPEFVRKIRLARALTRNKRAIVDDAVALWESAAHAQISEEEAMMRFFGGRDKMSVVTTQSEEIFRQNMLGQAPIVDGTPGVVESRHGAYIHVFHEYMLARAWGRAEARAFIQEIAAQVERVGDEGLYSVIWNALFDEFTGNSPNIAENLGEILIKRLRFKGKLQ